MNNNKGWGHMNRFRHFAAALVIAVAPAAALAEDRALIIGNGAYANAPSADTAVQDAQLVAEGLEDAGWTVTLGTDLDRAAMRELIATFADEAEDADRLVVFYSGHALRTGGQTYLAPTDAAAGSLTEVLFDGVPLELIFRIAAEQSGKAVIFLDGAQLRGFRPTDFVEPGLATLDPPDGVMVVSAAMPGRAVRRSRHRESRFARLILDQFLMPGASVQQVAHDAEPPTFHTGTVHNDFALAPIADGSGLNAELELEFWRAAEASGRPEDYRAYLDRFPNGLFAVFARQRLGETPPPAEQQPEPEDPNVVAERELRLTRDDRRNVQQWLAALGHDPKGVDGIFGPATRAALERWQRSIGVEATGYLTRDQLTRLTRAGTAALEEERRRAEEQERIERARDEAFWQATGADGTPEGWRRYLERFPEGQFAAAAREGLARHAEQEEADEATRRERRAFRRARQQDTAEAYRDYLGAYPQGIYRDEALARLDEIEGEEREEATRARLEAIEQSLGLRPADRRSIEMRLAILGYDPGPQDGEFDTRTREAIALFQEHRNLDNTGWLDRRTLVAILNESGQSRELNVIDGALIIKGLIDALNQNRQ